MKCCRMALADSLAEKLNEANQTIQSLQEEKQNKDAEDEEKRIVRLHFPFWRFFRRTCSSPSC